MRNDLQKRRAERARNGSNRRRDNEALREEAAAARIAAQIDRRERLLAQTKKTQRAEDLWEKALARIREAIPESTFRLWIEPLVLVGEVNESLHLEAPEGIHAWVERRYGYLLGETAREVGERCKGVYVTRFPDPHDSRYRDADGLM